MMTRSNFHTEDPQILGATLQNIVAMAICRPGFVHPCCKLTFQYHSSIYAKSYKRFISFSFASNPFVFSSLFATLRAHPIINLTTQIV